MGNKKKFIFLILLVVLFIGLDQWTKQIILDRFRLGETLPLISGIFNFTYVQNTGAAFGVLANADPKFRIPFFMMIPVIAMVAIFFLFKHLPKNDWRQSVGLSLILSGALGNLIDRIRLGFVVDFLDFHWNYQAHFPAFNIADSAISIGVGLLILDMFIQEMGKNKKNPA